jgi:methyl-accepting chemotaxis protein
MLSDYRADFLPPPICLVEAFSNASIMAIHRDAYAINEERLAKLEKEYWAAERRWAQRPLSDKLKTGLDKNAQETGKAFWDEINTSLKPAAPPPVTGNLARKPEPALSPAFDKDDWSEF